jgi:hypothetical protein
MKYRYNLFIEVFWIVTQHTVVVGYQHFIKPCCLHLQCEMEVARSSEMLISYCNTTWHHNPGDINWHLHCYEYLKSCKTYSHCQTGNTMFNIHSTCRYQHYMVPSAALHYCMYITNDAQYIINNGYSNATCTKAIE